MNCEKCNAILKECVICEKNICRKCDTYTKLNGYDKYNLFCNECKIYQCMECYGTLEKCIICQILFCEKCDDGVMEYEYGGDISYCKKHRPMNIDDLYKYMVNVYNEKLTLKEIEDKIKN